MSDSTKRCRNCYYWVVLERDHTVGTCATLQVLVADHDSSMTYLVPQHPKSELFAKTVVTKDYFGCALFLPK